MVLVGPSTKVAQALGGFSDIETLGNSESFAVVRRFDSGELVDVGFHCFSELDQHLAALMTWNVLAPRIAATKILARDYRMTRGMKLTRKLSEQLQLRDQHPSRWRRRLERSLARWKGSRRLKLTPRISGGTL